MSRLIQLIEKPKEATQIIAWLFMVKSSWINTKNSVCIGSGLNLNEITSKIGPEIIEKDRRASTQITHDHKIVIAMSIATLNTLEVRRQTNTVTHQDTREAPSQTITPTINTPTRTMHIKGIWYIKTHDKNAFRSPVKN